MDELELIKLKIENEVLRHKIKMEELNRQYIFLERFKLSELKEDEKTKENLEKASELLLKKIESI